MVYIYFGGQSFTSPSVIMPGESSGHSFGNSLAVIDMDNDGYDDLIVGDPDYDADYDAGPIIGTASEAGKIYAYAGGTEFSTTPSFIMEGSFAYDCGYTGYYILTSEMIGMVMAPAGDINGDGYQDLIVGNPYAGNGRSGSIMFILGDPLFHGRSIKIDNPGCDEYMGAVVAPVGDINGDGYSDVAVGVNSTTVVFWGGTQIQRSDITLQAGAAVDGQNLLNHYTDDWDKSIAGLDFNGDGFSDIAVSSGSVISLFYGGADFDETPDLIIYGAGESVASLGDINNDGYDDLLTKQSVIFGNSNNETDVDLAFTFLSPHIPFNGIGDVDGDGIKDVITPDSKVYSLTQYWDLPGIMLTTPLPSVVHTQTIDINGSVSGNSSRFFINGTESQLTSENTFAAQTNLTLGDNKIELIAETTGSGLGKRILDVRYNDYYPLSFNSLSPSDGSTFTTRTITVSGSVNNTLQAVHVNDYDAVISYNGTIANNTFSFDIGLTGSGTRIKVTPIDVHGQSVSQSLIVYYVAPLPVINFSATPNGLNEGETTTLSWTTQNADTVSIDNGLGDQALNGSLTVSPGEPTTYTLTATGPEGTSTQSVTVGYQPKISSLSADKIAITLGETATLSWSTSWADSVSIDQNIGTVVASGTHTVSPVIDTTYTLTATNMYGTATDSITITVALSLPTATLTANPASVQSGISSTLTWNSSNATTCSIEPGIGTVGPNGSVDLTPSETTTYTFTATGDGGTSTATTTITVTNPISIQITSPAENELLARPDVMVRGTVANTSGNETGITVNGVVAVISGNQFVANHVPLEEGTNAVTATATDIAGINTSTSITVNNGPISDYISVTETQSSGTSPLETTLLITGTFGFDSSSTSCSGPAAPEFLTIEAGEYKVRMITEGIYSYTVEIVKDLTTYSDTVGVVVVNHTEIDTLLRAKWDSMRNALTAGDIEQSVGFFTDYTQSAYRDLYNNHPEIMADLAIQLSNINFIQYHDNMAEYDIRITKDETDYSFYLLFVKDENGLWKIRSF